MNGEVFIEMLENNPIVAAVKSQEGLKKCLKSECQIVFILFGNLMEMPTIVEAVKAAEKLAIVHIDLVDGLSPREAAVDFIKGYTKADGVISTKANLVRYAKTCGLLTIQRFFILDSIALQNTRKQMPFDMADAIEILPGIMPKIFREIKKQTSKPIIAGGLISDKEDVIVALDAGATAISSTNEDIWAL